MIWASVHLLANGDTRGTLLFGASSVMRCSISSPSSSVTRPTLAPSARYDLIALVAGVIAALGVMALHRSLFGVAAVAWGI